MKVENLLCDETEVADFEIKGESVYVNGKKCFAGVGGGQYVSTTARTVFRPICQICGQNCEPHPMGLVRRFENAIRRHMYYFKPMEGYKRYCEKHSRFENQ